MRSEWTIYAKQIVIFSLLFALLEIIVFATLSSLAVGQTMARVMTCQFYVYLIRDVLSLGILFFVLYRIGKKIREVNYGKLFLSALAFLAFAYHFEFLFKTIYFYATHPDYPTVNTNESSLETLIDLFSSYGVNINPPFYDPITYFIGELSNIVLHGTPVFVLPLVFNPLLLSLWVSIIVWLLTKKKNRFVFNESTLDN